MKTVYPEISVDVNGTWRAGCVIEENGMWNCPGLDYFFDTREEAETEATEVAEYYFDGCIDNGDDAQLGALRIA